MNGQEGEKEDASIVQSTPFLGPNDRAPHRGRQDSAPGLESLLRSQRFWNAATVAHFGVATQRTHGYEDDNKDHDEKRDDKRKVFTMDEVSHFHEQVHVFSFSQPQQQQQQGE